ncbi:MAG: S41 family peptidase [Chloroflexi bacterium]|nr:S41 family peptidase [Chloroflexota bacterium]
MDSTLRSIIKFLFAGMLLLTLVVVTFLAGFGSSYLLTSSGLLPSLSGVSPTTENPTVTLSPPLPSPLPGETQAPAEATLLPTPIPIPTPTNAEEEAFQLFWEVWDLVQRDFYGELPNMQEVTYAAIQGVLNTLGDQYTAFIEPQAASIIAEDATGEFEGIGAFVNIDETGALEIVGVFQDGPAEQAGVLDGDRVLKVDEISIVGMSLYEAINLIRGPADTDVILLIRREGVSELFEIIVTRARLEIPTIEVEMRDDDIGYIRLFEFNSTASELVEEGLEELLIQEPKGIVFDLRGNPGGWLDQAVKVTDLFLADGTVVIERWSDGREQSLPNGGARSGDVGEEIPLVVLVDRGSASASEIVAGALQDLDRAVLIGELTFGKGSVQRPFTLSDGSELRVTIARWFTPNDRAIHGEGLEPDIEVLIPEEGVEPDEDPQLERAVEYLLTGE